MSTDKENAENGAMEVEETSNETSDTKPSTNAEVAEDLGKSKEKDPKKKMKGKEAKKESKVDTKLKGGKTEKNKNENSESEEIEEEEDDENDENDENEKSGDDKVPLLDQPLELSGTRERKKVQRFSAEYKSEPKDAGPVEIPEGKGTQLGNIPRIEANIQKCSIDTLKPLHRILFLRVGKAKLIKKNIRKFNGFDFDKQSDQYAKKKQLVLKVEKKVLREICTVLDLRKPQKREDIVDIILTFLMKPEDSGKPLNKAHPKRSARSNHKSYSESEDDGDEEKGRKASSRQGKKKRTTLKEVSSDDDEDEDIANGKSQKREKVKDENSTDGVKNKEKIESKGDDSDDDSKEIETDEGENEKDKDEGSSDYSEGDISKSKRASRSGKNNKKQPAKKTNSKKTVLKKSDKKPPAKKRVNSEDESSEDEPLSKKSKAPPTDEEIKSYVKEILEGANLEETTMKIVCKQVYAHYPDFDLAHKKDFIKTTVKSLIST